MMRSVFGGEGDWLCSAQLPDAMRYKEGGTFWVQDKILERQMGQEKSVWAVGYGLWAVDTGLAQDRTGRSRK